jgi:hypothetical protein
VLSQPRLLGHGDDLRGDDAQPAFAQEGGDRSKELHSRRVPPALDRGWEVAPHVPQARGAEEGVAERMGESVSVGVTGEPAVVRDAHTAEHQGPALDEPVRVKAVTDAQAHQWCARSARKRTRSRGWVTLKLSGLPATM